MREFYFQSSSEFKFPWNGVDTFIKWINFQSSSEFKVVHLISDMHL